MTLYELAGIVKYGIDHGLGNLPVAATLNPEATTNVDDCAFGDIEVSGPNFTGKVFGITAIKGEFPEALEAFRLNNPDSDWDVCLPDEEIILRDKARAECEKFIVDNGYTIDDTSERFKFFGVTK